MGSGKGLGSAEHSRTLSEGGASSLDGLPVLGGNVAWRHFGLVARPQRHWDTKPFTFQVAKFALTRPRMAELQKLPRCGSLP